MNEKGENYSAPVKMSLEIKINYKQNKNTIIRYNVKQEKLPIMPA